MNLWKESKYIMPQSDQRVLVTTIEGNVLCGYWIAVKKKWMIMGLEGATYVDKDEVIAWQLLPLAHRRINNG